MNLYFRRYGAEKLAQFIGQGGGFAAEVLLQCGTAVAQLYQHRLRRRQVWQVMAIREPRKDRLQKRIRLGRSTLRMPMARQIPSGTTLGATVLSFSQLAFPLDGLGMPNCTQYVGTDAILLAFPPAGATSFLQPIPIPNNAALTGIVLLSQGATFSPGFNPLGVVTSNGMRGVIGQ